MREMKDSGIEWIREIPKEWKVSTIKQEYLFQTGGTPKTDIESYFEGENIWVNISDMKSKFITDSAKHISDDAVNSTSMSISPKGSLLYAFKLSVGAVAFCEKDMYTNEAIATFLPCKNSLEYLYYTAPIFIIMNANENIYGAKLLNQKLIKNAKIIIPPLAEQQKISAYLNDKCTKIDSIIEKQEKVIEKLKAYKLSVLTEAVTKGLNPDVKMKESGVQWIGEIPEHWEQTALKVGLADIQTGPFGSQLHAEDYIENGIYVINPANIINGKIVIDSKCSISYEKANELAQHLLSVGDIVFARRGEMGRCACALDDGIQKLCGTGCIKLKCNDRLIPKYIILYLQTHYIKQYLELNSVGTTMLNLNSTIISNIPILIPPISEQQQIVNYLDKKCSAIDKSIEQKQAIIEKLKEYKKSLIYEVVTGKREV